MPPASPRTGARPDARPFSEKSSLRETLGPWLGSYLERNLWGPWVELRQLLREGWFWSGTGPMHLRHGEREEGGPVRFGKA